MFIVACLCALALQQDPAAPGAGFDAAARIYQQVAAGPVTGAATLETRVAAVKARIQDLGSQIDQATGALASLERQEMEHTLAIQTAFDGEIRERRLADLQQNLGTKRAVIEENRNILERDLASAREDLSRLQIELDLARAAQPNTPKGLGAKDGKVDAKLRQYFRAKAAELGLPELQAVPSYWLGSEEVAR